MSPGYAAALDAASNALTGLFAAEIAFKLLGLGGWGFFSDAFNVFDLLVVALGVLELALTVRWPLCPGRAAGCEQCKWRCAPHLPIA